MWLSRSLCLGWMVGLGCSSVAAPPNEAAPGGFTVPEDSAQLVVVQSPTWNSVSATLTRYRRENGSFVAEGPAIPAVVGKSGLGWGLGLHPGISSDELLEPNKTEGDGRAPAGIFRLGSAMGYAEGPPSGTRWPYRPSAGTVCVDDPANPAYNQIVGPETPVTWASAEKMVRSDSLYRWLVLVDHNRTPVPRRGSCIFLHVWRAADKGTLGCTATEEAELVRLITWLDPAARPLLVQLPAATYTAVADSWGLPR